MRLFPAALIAAMVLTTPLSAQDFLQDFEDFVEEMMPQRQAPVAPAEPTPVEERPEAEDEEAVGEEPPLPRPRPEPVVETEGGEPEGVVEEAEPEGAPVVRTEPERVYQTACPALLSGRIVGDMLAPIEDGMCGIRSPLLVSGVRVNGREIAFSSPVTTNCQMAGAIADWVGEVDLYARAALDSGIAVLNTGTSLMCRNRNGAANGFVSEHGFGNALDVVGFTLGNGETIAVEADWLPLSAPAGKLLRQAHGAACGRFTTVLGPEANAEHHDHFHLDLGCHGQSCMAQICE